MIPSFRCLFLSLAVALGSATCAPLHASAQQPEQQEHLAAHPADLLLERDRDEMYERHLSFGSYVRGGTAVPNWMADGDSFWYADGEPEHRIIWKVDPGSARRTELFDVDRLRKALSEALQEDLPGGGIPFQTFTFENGERAARFRVNGREVLLDLATYAVSFPEARDGQASPEPGIIRRFRGFPTAQMEVPSNGGQWFATLRDYNLWIRSPFTGEEVQLTDGGIEDYEWGLVRPTFTQEWAQWSPDDAYIAVRRSDFREVPKIPVVDWVASTGSVEWVHFGMTSQARSELHIVDVAGRGSVEVEIATDPGVMIHVFGWLPDGSELIFATLDRAWQHLELRAADPGTGQTRLLLSESNDTFVFDWPFLLFPQRMQGMGYFTPLADGQRFLWMSERSGWWHLYLYERDGTLLRQLTDGAYPVHRILEVDEERGWVYHLAFSDRDRPYDPHLYRVHLEGGAPERLTDGPGWNVIHFSPSMDRFVVNTSSLVHAPRTELRSTDGSRSTTLAEADLTGLESMGWRAPEEFRVKAADGETDLHGVLFKPHDFDPNQRYPVIEFNYAYPVGTAVPRTFTGGARERAFAQLGYIVVMLDARGTPFRGKDFMDAVHGRLGQVELEDHVAALRQLAEERPYMDMSRVGITGRSAGGAFAIRALLHAPEVYHAGVARVPIDYEVLLRDNDVSPYLGLPEQNRPGYENASNVRFADRLEGRLLLIGATDDLNVQFASTMLLADAFIRAGRQIDMLVLPGETHSLSPAANEYKWTAIRNYFASHLNP